MDISYAPLRLRSNWSLLNGASPVEAFLSKAAKWGLPAMAITDDNLFGAVLFFEEARRFGVKPILGASLQDNILLLVENEEGYANLCQLLSFRDLEGPVDCKTVCNHSGGLVLITNDVGVARKAEGAFYDRVFLDHPNLNSTTTKIPIVAAGNAVFASPEDYETHRLLCAIRMGRTLESIDFSKTAGPSAFLRSPKEMARAHRGSPEALENTLRIAERCTFDLLNRRTAFPSVAGGNAAGKLCEHAFAGARNKYAALSAKHRERLDKELKTIIAMGFADYFLVVEDIVAHARSLGTPTAGRGSGAGSLVAYVLGITNVDPVKAELPFERFLNEGREDYPDLDVDFCWRLRDDVIDYTYRRFGHDKVAMIATYSTFRPRMALREVGKALGLSNPEITKIAKKLRRGVGEDQFHTLPGDPGVVKQALALSHKIIGFPRHLSVHCGGVVITPGPIASYAPLIKAEKGVVITAFDKRGVEKAGLVKLDLLGNRSLSTISEAVRLIEKRSGEKIDPENLPDNGAAGFGLIRSGRTVGCGQLESPAMRHLLVQIAPDEEAHIMQALALIRPGASGLGMKEAFIKRKRGVEKPPHLIPALAAILDKSNGIMLYEDDALLIAMSVAGFSPGDADRFRKALSKGDDSDASRALIRRFVAECEKRGVKGDEMKQMLSIMAKFRGYSFCRAHAASYARLACACAYLKARHPLEYWTAALNNNEGMYPKWILIEEARRTGVTVHPPCVNRSCLEFSTEGASIRAGLGLIASISGAAIERILRWRPFASLEDLIARAAPGKEEVETLIRCGSTDFTGIPRNRLLYKVMTAYKKMRDLAWSRPADGLGFELPTLSRVQTIDVPDLPRVNRSIEWEDEWEILGFTTNEHPLAPYRKILKQEGVESSALIPVRAGGWIRLAGIIGATRRYRTDRGADMQFLTFDDEAGVFEVVLFPDAWSKARFILDGPGPYIVEGNVDNQLGALTIEGACLKRVKAV